MWNTGRHLESGFLGGLNFIMNTLSSKTIEELPDFSNEAGLFVASDYGGQHQGAAYQTYSFVFTAPKKWASWETERRRVREYFDLDRRISFKGLHDKRQWHALPHFLGAASLLDGITVTLLVHRDIKSLFSSRSNGKIDIARPELAKFGKWKRSTLERMLRITYFFSFFVAGLSREGHRILWLTDQDDIVANKDYHQDLVDATTRLVSMLSTHRISHIGIGTTASDNGSLEIEDLTSIADLVSGAAGEVMTLLSQADGTTSSTLLRSVEGGSAKTILLIHWLNMRGLPLKHIVIAIDPDPTRTQLNFRRILIDTMKKPTLVDLPFR